MNNGNNSNNNGGNLMQSSMFMNDQQQRQMIANRQTFIEQVDNTYQSIMLPAKMSQNKSMDKDVINSLTDGAILALDMFIVACNDFIKDNDKDSINLAEKAVYDKWYELELNDPSTNKLTQKHRDFMIAALNGQNNERYRSDRMDKTQKKLFERDEKVICKSFGRAITNSQKFSEQQKKYLDPNINNTLKENQEKQLNEYIKNKLKYNKKSKQYIKPNISDLYFTSSGKNASFKHRNNDNDEKEVYDEIIGIDCGYDKIPQNYPYQNVIVTLSNNNKPIPSKIIYPDNYKKMEQIRIRCAKPFDNKMYKVNINQIDFNLNKIKKREQKHINKYGELGYKSIVDQEQESPDIDGNGNGNGMEIVRDDEY